MLSVVLIVNSDVADSDTVADAYIAARKDDGRAYHKFTYALGTNATRARDDTDRANFWEPLAELCDDVGAEAVFCVAGCPNRQTLEQHTGSSASYVNFIGAVGLARRVVRNSTGNPKVFGTSADNGQLRYGGGALDGDQVAGGVAGTVLAGSDPRWPSGVCNRATLQRYEDAIALEPGVGYQSILFPQYTDSWPTGPIDTMYVGMVGRWYRAGAIPATPSSAVLTDSQAIFTNIQYEKKPLDEARSETVVVGIRGATGDTGLFPQMISALVAKDFIDDGFTDVKYWYHTLATRDDSTESLVPVESAAWRHDSSDLVPTTSPQSTYAVTPDTVYPGNGATSEEGFLVFGQAFSNNNYADNASPNHRNAIRIAAGGSGRVGASDSDQWALAFVEDDAPACVVGSDTHETEFHGASSWAMADLIRRGASWAVAAGAFEGPWPGNFFPVGDPLYTPIAR